MIQLHLHAAKDNLIRIEKGEERAILDSDVERINSCSMSSTKYVYTSVAEIRRAPYNVTVAYMRAQAIEAF